MIAIQRAKVAMYRFNKNPEKGVNDLIAANLVANDPDALAVFLCEEPGISRVALGDFFGAPAGLGPEVGCRT